MNPSSIGQYSVTYPKPGTYTFEFTATDNDKLTATGRVTVVVRQGW